MTQKKIIENFAEIIWLTLPEYNKRIDTQETVISKRFNSEFKKAFKWWLKHLGTLLPPHASKDAINKVREHNIDLFALQWKDQSLAERKMGTTKGRQVIYHEHEIPVDDLFNKILLSNSKATVIEIIKSSSIVWVTREEEKRLKRFKRDEDAYTKAGIIRIDNPYQDKWMEKGWDIDKRKN